MKRSPLPRIAAAAVLALVIVAAAFLFRRAPAIDTPPDATAAADGVLVERGRYLADAGNCFSCHTVDGGAPYAGGVSFETPFGTIYSTNITPDEETGIGAWSLAAFRRAMHEGIAADGSLLFPAFPYPSYTRVTDEDVRAIYTYLRTLEPVAKTPPKNSFFLTQRWPLKLWNLFRFEGRRFRPDSDRSDEWNRGAYLVEGLGHCGACHTPRDAWLAEIPEKALHGGTIRHAVGTGEVRDWFAVDLSPSRQGLGSWSKQELAQYLGTGFSRRAGTFGPMNDVIVNSLMKLTDDDVSAMATYLTSLPARDDYTGATIAAEAMANGEEIYEERCEECHSGSGRGGIFSGPPLAGSAIVQADSPSSLINIILYGADMPEAVSFGAWETMEGHREALDDHEVAAVSNYVRGSWGNVGSLITPEDVARQR